MIEMSVSRFIFLCLVIFAAGACRKETEPVENPDGYGRIVLTLDSRKASLSMQSKATDLQEGNEFSNLLVIVTNQDGNVIDKKDKTYGTDQTRDVISFDDLVPGNYHIYAYANYTATDWQQTGISTQEKTVAIGTSFSSFLDRELASLTASGTDVPGNPASAMLLTGDVEVPVGLSTVPCELDLIRPVVRFKVTVYNHTPYPVKVKELRFSHFNPDKAYIIPHKTDDGLPDLPSGVTYRQLPAFDPSASGTTVAAEGEGIVYQTLLYESAYPGTHKIFATLMLDRSSDPGDLDDLEIALGARDFGVIDYATLSAMDDGEQVDVLVMNPQKNVRSGRILAYISTENNLAWESAGYNSFNAYLARAQAIYEEQSTFNYTGYSFSNANGYSGWDGLDASAGSEATSFSYTGKRSTYFHTLAKSGGVFSLSGLARQAGATTNNTLGESTIALSDLIIDEGTNTKSKCPSDIPGGTLVRFRRNNTTEYIYSDCLYANTPNRLTFLRTYDGLKDNGDRQFVLFGKYCSGGLLKRILKENNKEVPLTYLARNEEVNVIINVYYADQTGSLDFSVDNSTWSTATTPTHTFK